MSKSFIELNGKKYDAGSGKLMSDVVPAKKSPSAHKTTPTPHKPAPAKAAKKTPSQPRTTHHQARKPQGTKTLMRHAVSRPSHKEEKIIKGVSSPAHHAVKRPTEVRKRRDEQAAKTSTSPHISRFGHASDRVPVHKKTEHVPVAKAPDSEPPIVPANTHAQHHSTAQKSADDHIAKALEKANSHTKKKLKKPRAHHRAAKSMGISPKFLSGAAATFAVLLLAGFFAYQNVPNITVRMAASKAGFDAKLPGYHPSGFALSGPVQAGPGVVTLNFASNSDDRSFQLTERPSEWNSASLESRFVTTQEAPYETHQEAGRTVYIYNENNATWVSGGVWYQIEGNASLTTDQLLSIASSL